MMIRKEFLVAMSVLVLLGSGFLSLIPFIGVTAGQDADAGAPVEITSDIIVGSGEVEEINDVEYEISADIRVENGGILYINNSKFIWGGTTDGEFGLYVENGGELYIDDNCNFTAKDTTTYQYKEKEIQGNKYTSEAWGIFWKFDVAGKARINNSEFSYLWGETGGYLGDCEGGIICRNDDIWIYNCKIQYVENAGIAVLDPSGANGNYAGGYSPTIDMVTIDNSSNNGIFIGGDASAPKISNCTVSGAKQLGIEYFAGADGTLDDTIVTRNEDGMQFDGIGTSYSADIVVNRCDFTYNNGTGYLAGRGGGIDFNNCTFDNNGEYGLVLQYNVQYGAQPISMTDCSVNSNGKEGMTALDPTISATMRRVEVGNNGGNGIWLPEGTTSAPMMFQMTIHDNGQYGLYSNGSLGQITGSILRDNFLGDIYLVNGSQMTVEDCMLSGSEYGIIVEDSSPILDTNDVSDSVTGIKVSGDSMPIIYGGELEGNQHGLHLMSDSISVEMVDFIDNMNSGLTMEDTDANSVEDCTFSGNGVALNIMGEGVTTIENISVSGSSNIGLEIEEMANVSVWDSDFMSNTLDLELSGTSIAHLYSTDVDSSLISILDTRSEVWVSWEISVWVKDNITGENVSEADLIVYTQEGNILGHDTTFLNGQASTYVLQYSYEGTDMTDYTPVNITVSLLGFVPYWDKEHENTQDHYVEIMLAENRAPVLPIPLGYGPVVTHQNRPSLTWDAPYDWNEDNIDYTINVWQDSIESGQHLVIDKHVPENNYTFNRNLRYNKEFWVEIVAYDPWGLNDTATFSFRTTNTPPTQPVVRFRESPVPSLTDIEIMIVNQSTDENENPVDSITYLVEWYAYREESWVMITSGSNLLTLDHNLTMEGDTIRAVIKSFDGIEYGIPVTIETDVINFAPVNLVPFVEVEMMEDTPESGLVDLHSLFEDRDGDDLSFRVKIQRHVSADIDQVTGEIVLIPDPDWSGEDYLIIEAYDNKPHMQENPVVRINITVSNVNDPPTIDKVIFKGEEIEVEEGRATLIQDLQGTRTVIDVDGSDPDSEYIDDEVEYSTNFEEVIGPGVLDEDDIMFEKTTGRLTIFLKNSLVGEHFFNFTITDNQGVSTSIPIRLIVDNVNDGPTRPEITSHTNGESISLTEEDRSVTFTASASYDPDMDIPDSQETLEYDWNFGEGWIENQGLEYTREFTVSGEYEVRVRVRDSLGLFEESSIKLNVNVSQTDVDFEDGGGETPFLEEWGFILILIIIAIVVIAVIFILLFRKDKLSDTAEEVEKEHEALVAKQQEEAMVAQEKLQALMSGVPYPEATGPALPSGEGAAGGYDALPSASAEGMPQDQGAQPPGYEQQYPEGGYQQPPMDQYPSGEMQQPEEQQMQAPPMPEQQPMQAAPMPEPQPEQQPQAPEPAPGMTPPPQQEGQENPSYLPPEEEQQQ